MATPRVPLWYPNLLRAVRSCEPQTYRSIRHPPKVSRPRKARLHTSPRLAQEAYSSRYGPAANQNLPPPPKPHEPLITDQTPPKKEHKEDPDANPGSDEVTHHVHKGGGDTHYVAREQEQEPAEPRPEENEPLGNKELDMVLSIPSPSELKDDRTHRHPHLEASPYEHHFDTYSLVQQLATENAYTSDQAVTLMKAIRLMLAINLDVAKEGLVSKSDTENEAYLFRAACSELRTTLQTARHSEMLKQRSTRSQLQHEADLLTQKVSQELMTLREELKAMFNDRKLSLEEEKRKVDGKIQELNYMITTSLTSEAKSDVEGLRWVLTRRAALAIGVSAFMIIAALNYSGIKIREKEEAEKKRKAAKAKQQAREREMEQRYTTPSRDQGVQTGSPSDRSTPARNYEESLG